MISSKDLKLQSLDPYRPFKQVFPDYANASIVDILYIRGANGITGFTVSRNGGTDTRTYYYRKNTQGTSQFESAKPETSTHGLVLIKFICEVRRLHALQPPWLLLNVFKNDFNMRKHQTDSLLTTIYIRHYS